MSAPPMAKIQRVDPKHGELGVLIAQNARVVLHFGDTKLTEVTDVYVRSRSWEEFDADNRYVNKGETNFLVKSPVAPIRSKSFGTEAGFRAAAGVSHNNKEVGFSIGGKRYVITNGQIQNSAPTPEATCDVPPGHTLFKYNCVWRISIRKWWMSELGRGDVIITEDRGLDYTFSETMQDEILKDTLLSTTELSGEEQLGVNPIGRHWIDNRADSPYERVKHSDLALADQISLQARRELIEKKAFDLIADVPDPLKSHEDDHEQTLAERGYIAMTQGPQLF